MGFSFLRAPLLAVSMLPMLAASTLADDEAPTGVTIHNLADDFEAAFDATEGQPMEVRRVRFMADVASQFPLFYKPRMEGEEGEKAFAARIDRAIDGFPALREAYDHKLSTFAGEIGAHVETFKATFDDFDANFEVYVLHSLGQMDGGTRVLGGKFTFIFGTDVMARIHKFDNEAPFFHHELFHLYHYTTADTGAAEELWCRVWGEGLAVYVSGALNPDAGRAEMLLEVPRDMVPATDARLKFALEDLKAAAMSKSGDDYNRFLSFDEDTTGLPKRRGYYLGYLIAREIAKDHDLKTLGHMAFADVEPLFMAALDKLIAEAPEEEAQGADAQ